MRPLRLEVEGFTAFRHPVVVDLEGADLFALTGPTGAGKSSLIDAIGFALYGSVPRLDDRRAVAPVISAQANEARVRLDFAVGGERYCAVRVVRRRPGDGGGASTKEARLERTSDGEVLAGTADEVTAEVQVLLGLGFDHFTKCVVLPQGQFQRLLHDNPAERQKLLVSLLDLGLYKAMAQAAGQRSQEASRQAELAEALVAELAAATPEAREEAAAHVAALAVRRDEVAAARPALDALRSRQEEAERRRADATAWVGRLRAVAVPDGLADRGMLLAAARDAAKLAEAAEEERAAEVDAAEERRARMPTRTAVDAGLRLHAEQEAAVTAAEELAASLAAVQRQEEVNAAEHLRAEQVQTDGLAALERARWEHRAHDLRAALVPGAPCPVCRQAVAQLPEGDEGAPLDAAQAAAEAAATALRAATEQLRTSQAHRERVEADAQALHTQLARTEAALAGQPAAHELVAIAAEIDQAEAAFERCRAAFRPARAAATEARSRVTELAQLEVSDRRRFAEARDAVAALGPPAAAHDELVADWEALAAWAAGEADAQRAVAEAAAEAASAASTDHADEMGRLGRRLAEVGVDAGTTGPWDAVGQAWAEAKAALARLERDLQQADAHRSAAAQHRAVAGVAQELARHLGAKGFEKWVLDEALSLLVEGATEILLDLSAGAYSLGLDERGGFEVVDHRNADERRSARTLSGGETFLASLALALALADQLSRLASRGAAKLESIFLDEGFGALDAETLDTVTVAIEELGARGRTVGLVSHVAELAERVPVRFVVTKGPTTSTVERVEG